MKKVLVQYQIPKEGLQPLYDAGFEVHYPTKEIYREDDLLKLVADFEILISSLQSPITEKVLHKGKKLQLISNYGVGYNNIPIKKARELGIAVANTPISVCEPTAELAMGLLLATMRNITQSNLQLRKDKDFRWGNTQHLATSLTGKQLGIVGMGRIGRAIARRAIAFGMKIAYHNRNRLSTEIEQQYDAHYLSFNELLKTSDVISLNTPLTLETEHLMGETEFQMMKSSAYLLNTARGNVVNEQAMIKALKNKEIAGAGLDVFEDEPHIPTELLEMQNVTLTPHIGIFTYEDRIRTGLEACENIILFCKGKPQNIVN